MINLNQSVVQRLREAMGPKWIKEFQMKKEADRLNWDLNCPRYEQLFITNKLRAISLQDRKWYNLLTPQYETSWAMYVNEAIKPVGSEATTGL